MSLEEDNVLLVNAIVRLGHGLEGLFDARAIDRDWVRSTVTIEVADEVLLDLDYVRGFPALLDRARDARKERQP